MKIPEYNVGDVVRIKKDLYKCESQCGVVSGMEQFGGLTTRITNRYWVINHNPPQYIYYIEADNEVFAWDYPLFEDRCATLG